MPKEYEGLGGRGLTSATSPSRGRSRLHAAWAAQQAGFRPRSSGRYKCAQYQSPSVGCKSPLTGGIKEANAGGQCGGHLAKPGIMAIVVEGMAPEGEWWDLVVEKDSAWLVKSEVAGLNNWRRRGHAEKEFTRTDAAL